MPETIQNTIREIDQAIAQLKENAWQGIFETDENDIVTQYSSELDTNIYLSQNKAIVPAIYDYIEDYGPITIAYNDTNFILNNKRTVSTDNDLTIETYFTENEDNNFNLNVIAKIIEIEGKENSETIPSDPTEEDDIEYETEEGDGESEPATSSLNRINKTFLASAISPTATLAELKQQKKELEEQLLNSNAEAWKNLINNIQLFITNFSPIIFSTVYRGEFELNNEDTNYGIQKIDDDNIVVLQTNFIQINGFLQQPVENSLTEPEGED